MTTDIYHSSMELPITPQAGHRRVPLSRQVARIYMALLRLGTDAVSDSRQVKYIQICNFVAITTFLVSLIYLALSILWWEMLWCVGVSGLGVCSISVLWLHRSGHVNITRISYLIAMDTMLYFLSVVLGPEARSENFLLVAVLLPFLMYDLDRVKIIIAGVALPVGLLLSFPYAEPYFAQYHQSIVHQHILRALSVPLQAGLTIAAVYQFLYYSRRTEVALEASYQRLTQYTSDLKRSNADLEQFAYVISHDLKTPVRNIFGFMKLLSAKHAPTLNDEAREFVDFAMKGAKRMEQLIDDVLAYSRIGRNLPAPMPVNVNDMVQTIKSEIEGRNDTTGASIIISGELPVLHRAHSSLLYNVFHNLIRNGLKFNSSERPEVCISCTESGDHFTFAVADNGIGISKQYSTQVFHMFKRLHNENEYDGTGIGLAICKKIVEHYNGEIWYESDGKNGTTFFFTIRKF